MHEHTEGNGEDRMTQWSEEEELFADYTGSLESVEVVSSLASSPLVPLG